MKKAMSKIAQINKEELSKVELGAIEDLVKVSDKAEKVVKKGFKIVDEYEAILKQAKKVKEEAEEADRQLSPVKTKVFQEAKALGGSIFSIAKNTPEYKNSISLQAELDLILRKLSKI